MNNLSRINQIFEWRSKKTHNEWYKIRIDKEYYVGKERNYVASVTETSHKHINVGLQISTSEELLHTKYTLIVNGNVKVECNKCKRQMPNIDAKADEVVLCWICEVE